MTWLCGRQRVKRVLLPALSISAVVRGVQLWGVLLPLPVLAAALLDAVPEELCLEVVWEEV